MQRLVARSVPAWQGHRLSMCANTLPSWHARRSPWSVLPPAPDATWAYSKDAEVANVVKSQTASCSSQGVLMWACVVIGLTYAVIFVVEGEQVERQCAALKN